MTSRARLFSPMYDPLQSRSVYEVSLSDQCAAAYDVTAGELGWAGLASLFCWIPFMAPVSFSSCMDFEATVYSHLESDSPSLAAPLEWMETGLSGI